MTVNIRQDDLYVHLLDSPRTQLTLIWGPSDSSKTTANIIANETNYGTRSPLTNDNRHLSTHTFDNLFF